MTRIEVPISGQLHTVPGPEGADQTVDQGAGKVAIDVAPKAARNAANKVAIVGHRGVGKSALLARLEQYFLVEAQTDRDCSSEVNLSGAREPAVAFFDLDREIERRTGRTVADIFSRDGEAAFRNIEQSVFADLNTELTVLIAEHRLERAFLACGAGFDSSVIGDDWRVLWLRRETDSDGRIFLNRPRLNADLSALDEYIVRYREREPSYAARADEVYVAAEGIESGSESVCYSERLYFRDEIRNFGGTLTVLPWMLKTADRASYELRRRVSWGVSRFELRDDLLSAEQVDWALNALPKNSILFSFRDVTRTELSLAALRELGDLRGMAVDRPIEHSVGRLRDLQSQLPDVNWILSLHQLEAGATAAERHSATVARAEAALKDFAQPAILKLALRVEDFHELSLWHRWAESARATRVFLPMSSDGRWAWYRSLMQLRSAREPSGTCSDLDFFREDSGSAVDQPRLLQRLELVQLARSARVSGRHYKQNEFVAVLGDPVRHSRTPVEHQAFFAERGMPVFAVRVTQDEWREGALDFLTSLGLKCAAVTAPLKELAFESSIADSVARELRSVNTLMFIDEKWRGSNTDLDGFCATIDQVAGLKNGAELLAPIAVWGGGGTLAVVERVVGRHAEFFSVRTGENRSASERNAGQAVKAIDFRPETVIWAASNSAGRSLPPKEWAPARVIDLNYSESSFGREYASQTKSIYISGEMMFREQARRQREIWLREIQP